MDVGVFKEYVKHFKGSHHTNKKEYQLLKNYINEESSLIEYLKEQNPEIESLIIEEKKEQLPKEKELPKEKQIIETIKYNILYVTSFNKNIFEFSGLKMLLSFINAYFNVNILLIQAIKEITLTQC